MSKYSIDNSTLSSIANAIRTKLKISSNIKVSDFAQRILDIPTSGEQNLYSTEYRLPVLAPIIICCTVFNNEIHVWGYEFRNQSNSNSKLFFHLKYGKTAWIKEEYGDEETYGSPKTALVYKDELYYIGYIKNTSRSKMWGVYRNNKIIDLSQTIPLPIYIDYSFIYKDRIHIFGGTASSGTGSQTFLHYVYDDENQSWEQLNDTTSNGYTIFGNNNYLYRFLYSSSNAHKLEMLDDELGSWISIDSPFPHAYDSDGSNKVLTIYNDEIHLILRGKNITDDYEHAMHFVFKDNEWTQLNDLPCNLIHPSSARDDSHLFEYNNKLHLLGIRYGANSYSSTSSEFYKNAFHSLNLSRHYIYNEDNDTWDVDKCYVEVIED